MSLILLAVIVCAIITVAVYAIGAGLRYLRRGRPVAERPPEKWPLRVLYCIVAPVLAFSIVSALIILLIAGPCGLQFGFEEGMMVLVFGGALVPLAVAVLALGFAIQHGRQVVLTESAIAVLCAITLFVYDAFPHQSPPATYDPTNQCQFQGP